MNQNPLKTFGLATLLLVAGFGRPALAEEALQAGESVEPARQLIAQLRAELQPVDDQIAHAPFLQVGWRNQPKPRRGGRLGWNRPPLQGLDFGCLPTWG